jgi:hypothetical protein
MKMSKKAKAALDILNDGGRWVDCRSGETFGTSLYDKSGCVVKGFGLKTKSELRQSGLVREEKFGGCGQ